ncbi:hypothetical protein PLESTM_002005500 [Pleodorina starrii]|nr:hypothetical protein PLESTM_002005500 [Pleodorina starrii]
MNSLPDVRPIMEPVMRTLDDLPPNLLEHVVSFLPDNEIACNVRLVNKRIAECLHSRVAVRLSQLSPHHAFVRRWGGFENPAVRCLTFKQRHLLLCLTARSGSLPNLETAIETAGCTLTQALLDAAAESGHSDVCQWLVANACDIENAALSAVKAAAKAGHLDVVIFLLRHGRGHVIPLAIAAETWAAAAGAGQRALCEGLISAGITCVAAAAAGSESDEDEGAFVIGDGDVGDGDASDLSFLSDLIDDLIPSDDSNHTRARPVVTAAARGGHVALTDWLLQLPGFAKARRDPDLLLVAAYAFDAASLQQLYDGRYGILRRVKIGHANGAVVTAACGPAPDWRAKVEWLLAVFGAVDPVDLILTTEACNSKGPIAERPDAIPRLELLRQVELLWGVDDVPEAAIRVNNLAVVRYLHEYGLLDERNGKGALRRAAEDGNTAALSELVALGCHIGKHVILSAARHGHLNVLRWLLEAPEAGPAGGGEALAAVTHRGVDLAVAGAESGSLELMQWVWGQGCLWDELVSYKAAEYGSLELMQWMRARGCPWDPHTFSSAAESGSLEKVEWLAARGCPCNEGAFTAAAKVGSWLLLERMAALGCPMGARGAAYIEAGANGDLATLRCLRSLGCPWDPCGTTFSGAVYPNCDYDGGRSSPLAALRWLHAQGCPVDWVEVQKRAVRRLELSLSRDLSRATDVLRWVRSQVPPGVAEGGVDPDPDPALDPDPESGPDLDPDAREGEEEEEEG